MSFTGMSGRSPLMSVQVGGAAVALVVTKTWPGVEPQPAQDPNPEKATYTTFPVESPRCVRTAVTWRGGNAPLSISFHVENAPDVASNVSQTLPLLVPATTMSDT